MGGALPIPGCGFGWGSCGTWVTVVQGVGIAGDLDAEALAGGEGPGGGFKVKVPLVGVVRDVSVGKETGAAGGADADKIGVAVGAKASELNDKVGEWGRGVGVESDGGCAEDMEWCGEWCGGVGEEVVA